jgi:hypothetical protein
MHELQKSLYTSQQLTPFNPALAAVFKRKIEDLELTHLPRRISFIQGAGQASDSARKREDKVRKRKEHNKRVEWIPPGFRVRNDSEKHKHDYQTEKEQQRAVDGPHDHQSAIRGPCSGSIIAGVCVI